jgi:hypothetical protein
MAAHTVTNLPRNTVTRLTVTAETIATSFTFINDGSHPVRLLAGTEGAPPTLADVLTKGFPFAPGAGETERTVAGMFPGIVGANVIYAAAAKPSKVIFSYA